jgi:AcrR family transcriptional regulator
VVRKNDPHLHVRSRSRRALVEREVKKTAAHVFLTRGVANASLGDVAAELGTARTALYHYFKSKDELLVALITECAAEARQILAEARVPARQDAGTGDDEAPGRLWEAVRGLAMFAIERPERVLLLDAAAELPPKAERTARRLNRLFFADLERLIQAGIDSGAFRPVDAGVAGHAIVGSTRSLVWWFDPAGPRSADYVASQIADSAVNGVLADGRKGPPPSLGAVAARLKADVDALTDALDAEPHLRSNERRSPRSRWKDQGP